MNTNNVGSRLIGIHTQIYKLTQYFDREYILKRCSQRVVDSSTIKEVKVKKMVEVLDG